MRKLTFHYEMQLDFDDSVTEHHFLFRCLPYEDSTQKCYGIRYGIEPAGSVCETVDGFDNRACMGEIMGPHRFLKVWAQGQVYVDSFARGTEQCHPMFLFPSEYTVPDQGIRQLVEAAERDAAEAAGGTVTAEDRFSLALVLMHRLYRHFSYAAGKTSVYTTAAQAFAGGSGVCQDYAHIFIALCRTAGIPARYVAGMMVGEGATHAWVEVWSEGTWIGMDPTHDCVVNEEYIKLSHGRDFGDCAVDRGCFQGATVQHQKICVKVEEKT